MDKSTGGLPLAVYVTNSDPHGKLPQLIAQKLLKTYLSGDSKNKDTILGEVVEAKVLPGRIAVVPWKGDVVSTMNEIALVINESGSTMMILGTNVLLGDNGVQLRTRIARDWAGKPINYSTIQEGVKLDRDSGILSEDPECFNGSFYFAEQVSGDLKTDKIEYLVAPAEMTGNTPAKIDLPI